MADIISILSAFPGVNGVCLFASGQQPRTGGQGMPPEQLHQLAMQAAMFFRMAASDEFTPCSVTYSFDHHGIVALSTEAGSVLVLACEPQANTALIASVARKMLLEPAE